MAIAVTCCFAAGCGRGKTSTAAPDAAAKPFASSQAGASGTTPRSEPANGQGMGSSSGSSVGTVALNVMKQLACSSPEVRPAGVNNYVNDGTNMTFTGTCTFYDDSIPDGSIPLNVYTFKSASDATRWVTSKTFIKVQSNPVDNGVLTLLYRQNWVVVFPSGDNGTFSAIATKLGGGAIYVYHPKPGSGY
jgi:hypothetical protein